jgi:uncharacterized protein (DUF2267 family)
MMRLIEQLATKADRQPMSIETTLNFICMNFEQYAPEANKFVREVAEELGNARDTDQAYRIMKSVLHTVREVLSPEESLHFIAQLPLMIKGMYVDSWHIPAKNRIRSMPEFLTFLREQNKPSAARDFGDDETAKHHVKLVLNVVKRHVATGEIQHMVDQFPMELAELWLTEESDTAVGR